jgi:hypothetical protein
MGMPASLRFLVTKAISVQDAQRAPSLLLGRGDRIWCAVRILHEHDSGFILVPKLQLGHSSQAQFGNENIAHDSSITRESKNG